MWLKKIVFFFLLICISVSVYPQTQSVLYTAHRAGSMYAPENSYDALKNVLQKNVQRIEVDVRAGKDNMPFLLHNKKLNKTTNMKGRVRKYISSDLSSCMITGKDGMPSDSLPKLENVFGIVDGQSFLVLDIKQHYCRKCEFEKAVIEIIRKYNAYDWCMVQSFNDRALKCFRVNDTNVRLCKSFVYKPVFLPLDIDNTLRFRSLSFYDFADEFTVNHHFASGVLIRKMHKRNKKVHVWTLNSEDRTQKLIKRGVDGIISDIIY